MFCKERTIKTEDGFKLKTPILLPSVSSRFENGPYPIDGFLRALGGCYSGPLLISVFDYDLLNDLSIDYPSFIFLDSGGYECLANEDFFDDREHTNKNWSREKHASMLKSRSFDIPTVAISYDHPNENITLMERIELANLLFEANKPHLKEILLKPEPTDSGIISAAKVIGHLKHLKNFDIVGFTEKELGHSVVERMKNIQKIRSGMNEAEIDIPIHVFGNLDPITTPLYYFMGADIFDGLSWLRYIFHDEGMRQIDGYGSKLFGVNNEASSLFLRTALHNVDYMRRYERKMGDFLESHDYSIFGTNCDFFKKTVNGLVRGV